MWSCAGTTTLGSEFVECRLRVVELNCVAERCVVVVLLWWWELLWCSWPVPRLTLDSIELS